MKKTPLPTAVPSSIIHREKPLMEEARRAKKEGDRTRGKTRASLGQATELWELKGQNQDRHREELVVIL